MMDGSFIDYVSRGWFFNYLRVYQIVLLTLQRKSLKSEGQV